MKRRIPAMESNDTWNGKVQLVECNPNPQGIQLDDPVAVAKYNPSDIVELAKEIQQADSFVQATACSQLRVIAEQVRFLQEQARRVLEDAKQDSDLHHAACNFHKVPGNKYYLYRRPTGQRYFSMLSREEWGGSCPHEYLGAYRLEHDMSWSPESQLENRSNEIAMLDKILKANETFAITYGCHNGGNS